MVEVAPGQPFDSGAAVWNRRSRNQSEVRPQVHEGFAQDARRWWIPDGSDGERSIRACSGTDSSRIAISISESGHGKRGLGSCLRAIRWTRSRHGGSRARSSRKRPWDLEAERCGGTPRTLAEAPTHADGPKAEVQASDAHCIAGVGRLRVTILLARPAVRSASRLIGSVGTRGQRLFRFGTGRHAPREAGTRLERRR